MTSSIPPLQDQAVILDRLTEYYFNWVDSHIEIVTALSWEMSFNDLRAAVIYLIEFWYLEKLETEKKNEFYVKITKKWIEYYEEIFSSSKEEKKVVKISFKEKIKEFTDNVNAVRTLVVSTAAVLAIFWITNNAIQWFVKWTTASILWSNDKKYEFEIDKNEAIKYLEEQFQDNWKIKCTKVSDFEVLCKIESAKLLPEESEELEDDKKENPWSASSYDRYKNIVTEIKEVKIFRDDTWNIKMEDMEN